MKKVSIIAVAVIFILSVVAVGFLGMAMHVYNPVEYVTSIEWINTRQVLDNIASVIPGISSYDPNKDNDENPDYPLRHRLGKNIPELGADDAILALGVDLSGDKKLNLNIKCAGIPQSATDASLKYYVSDDPENRYSYSQGDNNSFNLVVEEPCEINLRVSSVDGSNITYNIAFMFF